VTPGFSMMGSGIYSVEIDVEFVCNEDSTVIGEGCDNFWDKTVHTDDWGSWDAESKCPKCGTEVYQSGVRGE